MATIMYDIYMTKLQPQTLAILRHLTGSGVNPILYGSQGVSLYLGDFKKFNDIDLLVNERYLNSDWHLLVKIMQSHGYSLVDPLEHEFSNGGIPTVAFANEHILLRDGIVENLKQVSVFSIDDLEVRTLSKEAFIKAYEFSKRDGYRKEVRGKNDTEIISMLKNKL